MHIVVMNNDNFVAIHPNTVGQYAIECETTLKIYSVRKLNILIYVHYVFFLFWTLCFLLMYLELFVVSQNKYFFETWFVSRNIVKQKQSYPEVPLY